MLMKQYINHYDPLIRLMLSLPNLQEQMMETQMVDGGDSYVVKMKMPGVKKEDVHVYLKNGYLTVNSTKQSLNSFSRYEKSFYVGQNVKVDDINADINEGILSLEIKKVNSLSDKHAQS